MPIITLPDGSTKSFDRPVSGLEVAQAIGPRLAMAALGCKVNGELRDLSTLIESDAAVAIVTDKTRDKQPDKDGLFLIRHTAAHIMAEAIQDVLGKDVLLAYGPPTDTGFFYDMLIPAGKTLSTDHFDAINKRMAQIIAENRPMTRYEVSAAEGIRKLHAEGNKYKLDNAERALGIPSSVYDGKNAGEKLADGWALPSESGKSIRIPSPFSLKQLANASGLRVADIAKALFVKGESPAPNQVLDPATAAEVMLGLGFSLEVVEPQGSLSFYSTGASGKNWEDLCRGPHVPSTGKVGAARVMSLASAYWHGDENSDRLTRVYGTAFASQADLDAYLNQLQEAKARDHRVIGKHLRLFHIDEDVGQGLILWTPNGSIIRQELMDFIGAELRKQGYQQVFTPHIGRLDLYKTSGHFPYYKDSQFSPIIEREALEALAKEGCSCAEMSNRLEAVSTRLQRELNERTGKNTITDDRVMPDDMLVDGFMLKPMNCPHHAKIYKSAPHSYRDLPVRLAEFGTVYRWEQSGELNGMTRVRGFTQDDAHLFCTPDQVPAEIQGCLSLVKVIFATLGMKDYRVRVGLRDPDGKKYTGTKENWDKAEQACLDAAATLGVSFSKEPGEAAFYGPKIDFVVKDVIGREWQLGTVQVDYNMAIRFDLTYIGADNQQHRPVAIHRAPFGSFERFCGVLIEHFAGAFPTWLCPQQVRVLPISEKTNDYAEKVAAALRAQGVRVGVDAGGDRIQAKVKVAAEEKIPYMLIVGPRDAESGTVSVRVRGIEKDLGAMKLEAFVEGIKKEIGEKKSELTVKP